MSLHTSDHTVQPLSAQSASVVSAPSVELGLGDPAPWFSARSVIGNRIDLNAVAGRWVALIFLEPSDHPEATGGLYGLLQQRDLFAGDRLLVYVVLTNPPADLAFFASMTGPGLAFLEDYDRALGRLYGCEHGARTILLDPMLRTVVTIPWDDREASTRQVEELLGEVTKLPGGDGTAPALIAPRVFELELCDLLVDIYDTSGGTDSGFLMSREGRTETMIDYRRKRRRDHVIAHPDIQELIRSRVVRRVVPLIERYFQFRPTRMDRTIVSCYEASDQGHFAQHRDNVLPGSRHRRFALSIGLNHGFEGGDLVFPEFGQRGYRAPKGGAIVFATGLLHKVRPVTSGRRLVFLPFLYADSDVATRTADNAALGAGSVRYRPGIDDIALVADSAKP